MVNLKKLQEMLEDQLTSETSETLDIWFRDNEDKFKSEYPILKIYKVCKKGSALNNNNVSVYTVVSDSKEHALELINSEENEFLSFNNTDIFEYGINKPKIVGIEYYD